jgi:alkyl sulfatase BDS1-like metallo-beta-lactamase superfamily hydrolase
MANIDPPLSKPATPLTHDMNGEVAVPDWDQDPEKLNAGKSQLIALDPKFTVWKGKEPVWSLEPYQFLTDSESGTAPDTCNPSLWRNARLNMFAGLFEVKENAVYQVRGMDLSNITFLEDPADTQAKGSIVVVDPLVSEECAAAALDLYYQRRPRRPIGAVIYTHSHLDHYGGVGGLFGPDGPDGPGDVRFVAPDGFLDHAVDENVFVGSAMGRRAEFMYGVELPRGRKGQVDAGLGKTTSVGTTGVIPPNLTITQGPDAGVPVKETIAGIKFEFQLTPNTEAPSEMNFYLPDCQALCIAENATPTLHNVYSLRGAQVRDAKAWAEFLNATVADFGARTDTLFASHFWPRWNTPDSPNTITDFLSSQADLYRFLHDQAMRDANQGRTMIEVAEDLDDQVPTSLASQWFNHGYYGTANHNLKAVYQRYLGWYDGNAAHLHALPPEEAGRRYVDALGGPAATLKVGLNAFLGATSIDDYRWSAEVLSHLVFGYPHLPPEQGRHQLADVLEQLGYLAESGPWRNFYLCGALELRTNIHGPGAALISLDMMDAMTVEQVFDYLGLRVALPDPSKPLNAPVIGLTVLNPDGTVQQQCTVRYRNSVMLYTAGASAGTTDATYLITRGGLSGLALGTPILELEANGALVWQTGSKDAIHTLMKPVVTFTADFALTEP